MLQDTHRSKFNAVFNAALFPVSRSFLTADINVEHLSRTFLLTRCLHNHCMSMFSVVLWTKDKLTAC